MRLAFLIQMGVLLVMAQALLGGAGYLLQAIPWLGLPLLLPVSWMAVRTAKVLREEMARVAKGRVRVSTWGVALVVAVTWQLPSLAAMLPGAPEMALQVWQGAVLPLSRTLVLLGLDVELEPFLWLASLAEMALFVTVAGRPVVKPVVVPPGAARSAANGNWAPARRHSDLVKKYKLDSREKE